MKRFPLLIAGLTLVIGACTNANVEPTSTTAAPTTTVADAAPLVVEGTLSTDVVANAEELLAVCEICDIGDYTGPLAPDEAQGLLLALNDEYHAEAVYQQVLDDFGDDVRPFSNIIVAEQRHQSFLFDLFADYGLTVPDNPWWDEVDGFQTVSDACAGGVDAEIINATLYDYLYSTTGRTEIIDVYERLQAASNDKHLPAFERCGDGGRNA